MKKPTNLIGQAIQSILNGLQTRGQKSQKQYEQQTEFSDYPDSLDTDERMLRENLDPIGEIPAAAYNPPTDQPTPTARARKAPAAQPKQSSFLPAFWTIASGFSLLLNVVLIAVLLLVGRELFVLKSLVADELLSGLYSNFVLMDQARITTEISVKKDIPVTFDLPISQDLVVTLNGAVPISGANVVINTGGLAIDSTADIVLPAGVQLPIHLEMTVPVTTNVPVDLIVPVDIPLNQTDLHAPFTGLQTVISTFYNVTLPEVKTPQDIPFCDTFPGICEYYFK
jgi:hypothetical protein